MRAPARLLLAGGALWLAIMMALLLLGPVLPPAEQHQQCIAEYPLGSHARFVMNCDSPEFLRLAQEPGKLLAPGNARQSRPLFPLAASVLAGAWAPVAGPLVPLLPAALGPAASSPDRLPLALGNVLPAYLAYLSLNIGLLLAAFGGALCLLRPAVPSPGPAWVMLGCTLSLLLANDVVKAFIWTPHTQILNILVPVVALALALRPPGRRGALVASLLLGLGMLAYANMVIAFAALLCRLVLMCAAPPSRRRHLVLAVICVVLFALPSLAWLLGVHWFIGSFYVQEITVYHEFVWVLDAWQRGAAALARAVASDLWFFATSALWQALPALLLGGYVLARISGQAVGWRHAWRRAVAPDAVAGLLVAAISFAFYSVVGLRVDRLAYSAVPPLIWLVAAMLVRAEALTPGLWRRRDAWLFGAAAFAQTGWTVFKAGPLS